MWCFLKMMLFILTFRINSGAFGRNIFMNPESKMNIVSCPTAKLFTITGNCILEFWDYKNTSKVKL